MGDRASVIIDQSNSLGIEIYAHWAGTEIVNTLPYSLVIAKDRYDDLPYFTRIVTQNILNSISFKDKDTGAGLEICDYDKSNHGDLNNYPVFIDPYTRLIKCNDKEFTFEDIIKNGVKDLQKAMLM